MSEQTVVTRLGAGRKLSTNKAIERLKTGVPGDMITRSQMAEVIQCDCSSGSPGDANVRSAIDAVLRETGICWKWLIPEQVWKCLNDSEKIAHTCDYRARARRTVSKGMRVSASVNENNLTENEKIQKHGNDIAMSMMKLFGRDSSVKKIIEHKAFVEPRLEDQLPLFVKK